MSVAGVAPCPDAAPMLQGFLQTRRAWMSQQRSSDCADQAREAVLNSLLRLQASLAIEARRESS